VANGVTTDAALAAPFFASVRSELDHLAGRRDLQSLNQLAVSRGGGMRFVASPGDISAIGYETGIAATGQVPTRDNLHDFFNALQWIAFPLTKTAINARHLRHMSLGAAQRAPERDVVTMVDESGVLVACEDASLLTLLREFRWKQLFVDRRDEVIAKMRFALIGHGLMERCLAPFIGLTGKAILLHVNSDASLDAAAAEWIGKDTNLSSSHNLAPLPLLGIPGWDQRSDDPAFYDNTQYFRPGRMAEKTRVR
jgi:hypothetical protein